MTGAPLPTLAETLVRGYRAQLTHYNLAADILQKAGTGDQEISSGNNPWAHELHSELREAATLDAAMAPEVAAWRETGQVPAGPLKEVLELLSERIQVLNEGIDRWIGELRTHQVGLSVEIDEFIQNRRMLQAYVTRG